jgi:hypothetical protein
MDIQFTFKTFLNLLSALVISMGGATVIILFLSKFFGDFFAQRLLDGYKNKHEKELEKLKSSYQGGLEETKANLEKAKSLFFRYSEKQFDLYNDLWRVLLYTKNMADLLWEEADPKKIPSFSEQIKLTKNAINDNMLLIEEIHYNNLCGLIKKFEQFQFGKIKLIDFSNKNNQEDVGQNITQAEVSRIIKENEKVKNDYNKLIMNIGKSFRSQIKG